MTNSAVAKKSYFTYSDYKAWELAPGERFELICGEAYAMAAPSYYHQSILMELAGQLRDYLKGKPCKVIPAPYDVRLFYADDETDNTVVQPDISVICSAGKRAPEACRGAPDLAVEILSPSNTAGEMGRKFDLYRLAGVREYWVLDPAMKTLYAYRFNGEAILAKAYTAADSFQAGIFPDLPIDLQSVFEEEPPL
ncbi:MAG: Uma2 family endonuclease [Spirochaetaceae bacterium]|jgi:Uma2 family endonuclease|nr:Uma2 family endonuclease [Spirochaetaceae bacterium]